jgi:hypothetical protein
MGEPLRVVDGGVVVLHPALPAALQHQIRQGRPLRTATTRFV